MNEIIQKSCNLIITIITHIFITIWSKFHYYNKILILITSILHIIVKIVRKFYRKHMNLIL